VMHNQASIPGGVDIELNPIRPSPGGVTKCLE